jgi:O-antigen ligase
VQRALHLTVNRFETLNSAVAWAAAAAAAYLACTTFERRPWDGILNALLYAGAAIGVFGLIAWTGNSGSLGDLVNRDHFAAFVELIFPIALARVLWSRRTPWPSVASAGILFASVIACGSRAGAALVSLEAAVLAVAALRGRGLRWRALAPVAACMALFTALGGAGYLWRRLHTPDPFLYRREMLVATARMIQARPLFGFGLGTWPSVYPAYAVFDPPGIYMNHAHNDWAEWASEGGVIFVLPMVALAVAAAIYARRAWWGLGVAVVLLHASVDFPMQKPALLILTFYLLGALAREQWRAPDV